jgi:hypothetical protein
MLSVGAEIVAGVKFPLRSLRGRERNRLVTTVNFRLAGHRGSNELKALAIPGGCLEGSKLRSHRYCGSPTLRTSSGNRESERRESSK